MWLEQRGCGVRFHRAVGSPLDSLEKGDGAGWGGGRGVRAGSGAGRPDMAAVRS